MKTLMIRLFYPYNVCLLFFSAVIMFMIAAMFTTTNWLLTIYVIGLLYCLFMYVLGHITFSDEREAKLRNLNKKIAKQEKVLEADELTNQLIGQILIKTDQYSVHGLRNKSIRELQHIADKL